MQSSPLDLSNITTKLLDLDSKNKNLLSISQNMMRTSYFKPNDQIPTIIQQLEQEMKQSFNQLIQSIREYFINMDVKIKQIGYFVEQFSCENMNMKTSRESNKSRDHNMMGNNMAKEKDYGGLCQRIDLLEQNLKTTQGNQSHLINIIEEMVAARKHEDQPTIVKTNQPSTDKPKMGMNYHHKKTSQKLNRQDHEKEGHIYQSKQSNSFRIFSLKNQQKDMANLNEYNIYSSKSKPNIIESKVTPGVNIYSASNYPREVSSCFSMPPLIKPNNSQRTPTFMKSSLKDSNAQFQMENSNRIHRLTNMVKKLSHQ